MAVEVVWLDEAKDDLRALLDHIATENPPAAERYVAGIADACRRLEVFPRSGRRYDDKYRCIVFRNHLVFYRFDEVRQQVLIAAVLDGRRDIASILDDQ